MKDKKPKRRKKTLWTVHVAGGVEPSLHGPYKSEKARDLGVKDIEDERECDTMLKLDISAAGVPSLETFSTEEIETIKYGETDDL